MTALTCNQNSEIDSSCFFNGWRLRPDGISETEIPIMLGYCEKARRVELALWLLRELPANCSSIVENQIDMLAIEELRNPTTTGLPFAHDWSIKRKLVLDTDLLVQAVKDNGVIGLSHLSNLWVVHPSAKKPTYWQATHYDLVSCTMTGDTLHQSLEMLFHCSGAGIHPRAQMMKASDVETWLIRCHDVPRQTITR